MSIHGLLKKLDENSFARTRSHFEPLLHSEAKPVFGAPQIRVRLQSVSPGAEITNEIDVFITDTNLVVLRDLFYLWSGITGLSLGPVPPPGVPTPNGFVTRRFRVFKTRTAAIRDDRSDQFKDPNTKEAILDQTLKELDWKANRTVRIFLDTREEAENTRIAAGGLKNDDLSKPYSVYGPFTDEDEDYRLRIVQAAPSNKKWTELPRKLRTE